MSMTDGFPGEKTLVGETFVIDQATGVKQRTYIIIPIFLCDGITNIEQSVEVDVSIFNINGNILSFASNPGCVDELTGKYWRGNDNEYWFFATEFGLNLLSDFSYAETYSYPGIDFTADIGTLSGYKLGLVPEDESTITFVKDGGDIVLSDLVVTGTSATATIAAGAVTITADDAITGDTTVNVTATYTATIGGATLVYEYTFVVTVV